jgi:hypothetical protein
MDELRTTWRNLANEQVMFPLDMKDMPMKIGKERQLFLDNYLIAEAQHVTRKVHQPERFEGNPIIIPHTPKTEDLEYLAVVMNVMQFKKPPRFRMWYQSYSSLAQVGERSADPIRQQLCCLGRRSEVAQAGPRPAQDRGLGAA